MNLLIISPFRAWFPIAFIFLFAFQTGYSQQQLPLIRANSRNVNIKDGYVLRNNIWNLSPDIKPDIYYPLDPVTNKVIIFYTDIDSISFCIEPGKTYDFAVLLNGKDTCYTQISMRKAEGNGSLKLISPEQLAMDFVVFRNYLQMEHAGLYRYKTKTEMNRLFNQELISIREPMTKLEFGKKILFTISQIQDGHTGTNLSSTIMNTYKDSTALFPLFLFFSGNRAFVRCSKDPEIKKGSEVLTINGKSVSMIMRKLFDYLPGDGAIVTKKTQTLNNGSFAFLYHLVFGYKELFEVSYRESGGRIRTADLKATLARNIDCDFKVLNADKKDLQLQFLKNDVALLTIKTFDIDRLRRSKLDFEMFIKAAFEKMAIEKTKELIIDLRGNAGGYDGYGPLLYSYLTLGPFRFQAAVYTANNPVPLKNMLHSLQQPQKERFAGKVVFLIDGLSFSAAADFCSIARSNRRGKFVGEETGGAYYGNNSGQTTKIELPNSKIQVVIPRFRYFNAVKKTRYSNRGTIPDYTIIPSITDVFENNDVQLNFAAGLLEKER